MQKYRITAPDGKVYNITGENREGALNALQTHLGGQSSTPNAGSFQNDGSVGPTVARGGTALPDARNADGTYGQPPEGMALNPETGQMEDLRSPINPNIPQGGANALVIGAGQGLGLNMMDEAAAALTVPFGGDYDYNLGRMREAERRAADDHPAAYYGGQVGGALGTGLGLAKGGLSATNAAINSGWRLPFVAGASGLEGAALGAGYGFGAGEGAEGRKSSALTGGAIGGVAGLAMPFAIAGASKAFQKARSPFTASPERAAAVRTLESEGVPLTAGQKTGSRGLRYAESEIGGARAADMMDEQARAFTDAAMRKAGGSGLADPDNLGALEQRLSQGFKDISSRNSLTLDKGMVNDIVKTVNRYGEKLDALKKPVFDRVRIDIVNEFMKNKGNVSGQWYQQARSDLGQLAQSARGNDDMLAGAYRGLRNALDDAMERSIQKTNPSDLGEWKQLRKFWGNFRVVADASRGAGEAGGQGFITPAKLAQAAGRGKNGLAFATGKSDFTDLVKAGQAAMTPLPESGTSSRLAVRGLMSLPAGVGAIAGGATGDVMMGLGGAMAGAAVPKVAGKVLMSDTAQRYLANQIAKGPMTAESRKLFNALFNAQGGLTAGRLSSP